MTREEPRTGTLQEDAFPAWRAGARTAWSPPDRVCAAPTMSSRCGAGRRCADEERGRFSGVAQFSGAASGFPYALGESSIAER